MNRLDRKINYWGLRLSHGIILLSVGLIMGMLLIATSGVFIKSFNLPISPYQVPSEHFYIIPDSLGQIHKDSLVKFSKRMEVLEKMQASGLAELKQEENNNINKVNGWLGFWIAILAIFGGVVPMVLQYILRRKSKLETENLIDKISDKIENTRLQMLVSCMVANQRASFIRNSIHRDKFLRLYAKEAYLSFSEILDRIESENCNISQDDEVSLLAALIQYCKLMDSIAICLPHRKGREMRNLQNEVITLIEDILNHAQHPRGKIWDRLLEIKSKLFTIPLPNNE